MSYAHQKLDKLEDIREQSLAVSNGTVVQEILEEKHIRHTAVNGSSTMVSMLKEGRVQLIAISRADYIAAIKANKISNTELYRYFDIGDPYLRIACNRNIEFSTMRRINQAISQMQQAGSLKSLDAFDHR
ncbi:transporter substrate-binding domain-containing protein [Aquitalea pelogenes]|uniref:transporter substrate-binding domain-containing protein n=1 Tax=Aquitalea pelogenes TaxID=1293573 RepID=UPI000787DECE|nr:transporter substrate-binding domain-containing protein [Aquitalea pelogenes]